MLCDSFWDHGRVHLHSLNPLIGCLLCARVGVRDTVYMTHFLTSWEDESMWPTCLWLYPLGSESVAHLQSRSFSVLQTLFRLPNFFFFRFHLEPPSLSLLPDSISPGTWSQMCHRLFQFCPSLKFPVSQIYIFSTTWLHICLYPMHLSFITFSIFGILPLFVWFFGYCLPLLTLITLRKGSSRHAIVFLVSRYLLVYSGHSPVGVSPWWHQAPQANKRLKHNFSKYWPTKSQEPWGLGLT